MKKHIPNIITLGNLLCGFLAIIMLGKGEMVIASYLLILALFFDFMDGFAARILKVSSELGVQLDSLADMVSFGVAPGIIAYQFLHIALFGHPYASYISLVALLIPLCAGLRLAKFNIDKSQSSRFLGIPTPANAMLYISMPLVLLQQNPWKLWSSDPLASLLLNPYFLVILIVVFSLLMVSNLPLMAMKFKSLRWQENRIRFIFAGFAMIIFLLFLFTSILFLLILYIIFSLLDNKKENSRFNI